ncbi:MAG: hypothetical protein JWQ23_2181, partial [Herminiimonas sp.]|nr:hypothetical protein [Herminiimonas sp.]
MQARIVLQDQLQDMKILFKVDAKIMGVPP